jgi:hypothetical protein
VGANSQVVLILISSGSSAGVWDSAYSLASAAVAGANTALSNLAATSINQSLVPNAANTFNLGSSVNYWAGIFLNAAFDLSGTNCANFQSRTLTDTIAGTAIDWGNRALKDTVGTAQISWSTLGAIFNPLTATTVPYLDANKALKSSAVTPTELGYVSGVTSAVQTQLNGKLSSSGVLPIVNGGTAVSVLPTAAVASAFAAWDVNKNISVNNVLEGFTTAATAAGSTALTVSSPYIQQFTGTQVQTITLPATTTMSVGQGFSINNRSTKALTVNTSIGSFVQTINAGGQAIITCTLASGNTASSWDSAYGIKPGWTTSTVASGAVPVPVSLLEHVVFTNSVALDFSTTNVMVGIGTDGQVVRIWGPNNTSGSITIGNYAASNGQVVNGVCTLTQYQTIEFTYLTAYNIWLESDRNF